jgi:hypothetical protein
MSYLVAEDCPLHAPRPGVSRWLIPALVATGIAVSGVASGLLSVVMSSGFAVLGGLAAAFTSMFLGAYLYDRERR